MYNTLPLVHYVRIASYARTCLHLESEVTVLCRVDQTCRSLGEARQQDPSFGNGTNRRSEQVSAKAEDTEKKIVAGAAATPIHKHPPPPIGRRGLHCARWPAWSLRHCCPLLHQLLSATKRWFCPRHSRKPSTFPCRYASLRWSGCRVVV